MFTSGAKQLVMTVMIKCPPFLSFSFLFLISAPKKSRNLKLMSLKISN